MGNVIKISAPPVGANPTSEVPQFEGLPTEQPPLTSAMMTAKAQAVSDCMLEQYMGTAVGVGIGLALGIQRRNVRPFILAITLGTFGDWIHGYYGPCRPMIEDFNQARAQFEQTNQARATARVTFGLPTSTTEQKPSEESSEKKE